MNDDNDIDRRLRDAGERWNELDDRLLPAIDRAALRGPNRTKLATLARAVGAATLMIALVAVVVLVWPSRPVEGPVAVASRSPAAATAAFPSTSPAATDPSQATPAPSASPTDPAAVATPSSRPTPPSEAQQRGMATAALEKWAAHAATLPPDTVHVMYDLTTLRPGGWSGPNADEYKAAFNASLYELVIDLPTEMPQPQVVSWADGSTMAVELVSAAAAFDALASNGDGSCRECDPLHVIGVRLTSELFNTLEGVAEIPSWEFTLREGGVRVYRVAAAHAVPIAHDGQVSSAEPGPGTSDVTVHFTGGACVDGDRFVGLAVESNLAVAVAIRYEGPPESGLCIAMAVGYEVTITLNEPLGDRTVIDIDGNPIPRDLTWIDPDRRR